MKKDIQKRLAVILSGILLIGSFGGCTKPMVDPTPSEEATEAKKEEPNTFKQAKNVMDGIVANPPVTEDGLNEQAIAQLAEVSMQLFRQNVTQGKDSLISPTSALYALAMAANGAGNQTRVEMERALCGELTIEQLNEALYAFGKNFQEGSLGQLDIANSIWCNDLPKYQIKPAFLQKNADYYGVDIYKTTFNGSVEPMQRINDWVNTKTKGMIPSIMVQPPDQDTAMILLNAIAFEAEWETPYDEFDISDAVFHGYDETDRKVSMMHKMESIYLENDSVTGFVKNYAKGAYQFVALLPKEKVDINQYVAELTGEEWLSLWETYSACPVWTVLPKFQLNYEKTMNDALIRMGIERAFDSSRADFSEAYENWEGIHISNVKQKTFICVDENGTKAGAATIIEERCTSAIIETKHVVLDRPFIYAIIDATTHLPVFIGTAMNLGE